MSELPPDKQTKTYPVATNRLFLVTKCSLGRRVFINCAGFIRFDVDNISREIDEDEDNDYEKHTEILDSTRIHPEHYEWARKMAIDALEFEDGEDGNSNTALKEVIENPKCLKDLDLDAFAKELERTGLILFTLFQKLWWANETQSLKKSTFWHENGLILVSCIRQWVESHDQT